MHLLSAPNTTGGGDTPVWVWILWSAAAIGTAVYLYFRHR